MMPSANEVKKHVLDGRPFLMVSTTAEGTRGWVFGVSETELFNLALSKKHTEVVIVEIHTYGYLNYTEGQNE